MIEGTDFLTEEQLEDVDALARRILKEADHDQRDTYALILVEQGIAWGRRVERQTPLQRTCRVCGCTQTDACIDDCGHGCAWAGPNLCTACAPYVEGAK